MNARATREVDDAATPVESLLQLGRTLRAAREARGLTPEEVAARLRLTPRTVHNIEAGAFEMLPAATYARGYLRAYSNFVGLSPAPLLAAYDEYASKPPEIDPYASSPHPQVQSSDLPVRMVTYAIAALVIGLLGAWLWQSQKSNSLDSLSVPKWGAGADSKESAIITETVETVAGATAPATGTGVSPAPASTPVTVSPAVPTDAHPSLNAATAPAATPTPSIAGVPATPAGEVQSQTPADTTSSTTDVASRLPVEMGTALTAPDASTPATIEPSVGPVATPGTVAASETVPSANAMPTQSALAFELAEDSWIEVFDAENNRLYYDIGKQGSRISVQGVLPYRVKVGNAPAVLVSYEGRSLDIAAFSNGAVARFQVTADGFLAQP